MRVFKEANKEMRAPTVDEYQPLLASKISLVPSNSNPVEDASVEIDLRSFLTACAANLYEYYDFALLGFFATEISENLFPSNGTSAIIQLYGLYAVGFIARPFGGVVFGYFGDRYGRRSSLTMAMILMAFPTFLTGCIPGYRYIGWWAPIILLLLRVLQGLSTGGENSSASIYIYETAPRSKRAFWLSIFGICSSGTLVASFSHVVLQNILDERQLSTYGWRIPFLFGLGLFMFSLWAKKWLKKTDTFSHLETSPYVHRNPIKYVCSHNRCLLFKFVFASALQHGSAYMIFVFLPSYLSSNVMRGSLEDGWIDDYAYTINCVNSVLFLPICVLIGYYVDRVGTTPFLTASSCVVLFASPFIFYGLAVSTSSVLNWFYQFLLVMACVPTWACCYYWYIHALLPDPRTRVTNYGVGYNLGAAIFGGTASLIGSGLVSTMDPIEGMVWSGIWMSVLATLSILTIGYIELYDTPKRDAMAKEKAAKFNEPIPDKLDTFTSTWYLNPTFGKPLETIPEINVESTSDGSRESWSTSSEKVISPKLYG